MSDTICAALDWARSAWAGAAHVEPLDAHILLGHVLGVARAHMIAHPEQALTPAQAAQFRDLVARRAAGTPVAYLIGTHPFYDLPDDLIVTPDVLIPRPETEHLIDAALGWARGRDVACIADIGTGSGAIAVTLARHVPGARLWAVDVSPDALAVARRNAARYGVQERFTFAQGDLLAPLVAAGVTCDLIAANLPYIPGAEVDTLVVTAHEPRLALDGGADGLDLIRRLLDDVPRVLAAHGLLLLEFRAGHGERVAALVKAALPGAQVNVQHDLAGHDRIIRVERRGD